MKEARQKNVKQKNVRQKNEEDQTHSSFFCLTFFCLVFFSRFWRKGPQFGLAPHPQCFPSARRSRSRRPHSCIQSRIQLPSSSGLKSTPAPQPGILNPAANPRGQNSSSTFTSSS